MRKPRSQIRDPRSEIRDPGSGIRDPGSEIQNPPLPPPLPTLRTISLAAARLSGLEEQGSTANGSWRGTNATLLGVFQVNLFCPAVFRIQIRIHRIHMFLGLPDPDPSIIMQKCKKNLDYYYFLALFDFLS
jgi:hypothetical protein